MRATRDRSGVTVRCYGSRTGFVAIDSRCGWVGDSGHAVLDSFGAERCPRCGGSTLPPARLQDRRTP